jgi:hypothetical protein
MDTHNISVCVAPSLFHKSTDRQTLVDVESSFQTIAFVKHLIENVAELFGADTLTLLNNDFESPPPQEEEEEEVAKTAISKSGNDLTRMLNLVSLKSRKLSSVTVAKAETLAEPPISDNLAYLISSVKSSGCAAGGNGEFLKNHHVKTSCYSSGVELKNSKQDKTHQQKVRTSSVNSIENELNYKCAGTTTTTTKTYTNDQILDSDLDDDDNDYNDDYDVIINTAHAKTTSTSSSSHSSHHHQFYHSDHHDSHRDNSHKKHHHLKLNSSTTDQFTKTTATTTTTALTVVTSSSSSSTTTTKNSGGDLSSNTLSLDSGLSLPTTTDSETASVMVINKRIL